MENVTVRPRFSVVIPTLNNADSISRCMTGVLTQTLSSVEVVVVDVGSTDGTLDAVKTLGDSRVRVLNHAEATEQADGPSCEQVLGRARAQGFRKCRGQWSTTLDATDEVDPGWLSRLGKLSDRSGAAFISCGGDQRFSDMSQVAISPVSVPFTEISACLRSGSFAAPTTYFRALSPGDLADIVTAGLALIEAVVADGRDCVSTPESLLRWNEGSPGSAGESRDEQELTWAMQALDVLSRSPIPDSELLARYASLAGDAASRLGRRDEARKLFAIARNALPEVPRYWVAWAGSLLPFRVGPQSH